MANDGMLMLGLGALLFLGLGKPKKPEEAIEEPAVEATVMVDKPAATVVTSGGGFSDAPVVDLIEIGGIGGEQVTATELAVRRSEQVKKQAFSASVPQPNAEGRVGVPVTGQGPGFANFPMTHDDILQDLIFKVRQGQMTEAAAGRELTAFYASRGTRGAGILGPRRIRAAIANPREIGREFRGVWDVWDD